MILINPCKKCIVRPRCSEECVIGHTYKKEKEARLELLKDELMIFAGVIAFGFLIVILIMLSIGGII
jgi:hypothetical protein